MRVLQYPLVSLERFKTRPFGYIKRPELVVEEVLRHILRLPLLLDFLDVRWVRIELLLNKNAILHVGAHTFFIVFGNMKRLDCSTLLRCVKCEVDNWRMDSQHTHWCVLSVKLYWKESGLSLHALIDLKQTCLYGFKFCRSLIYLCFHQFGWIREF